SSEKPRSDGILHMIDQLFTHSKKSFSACGFKYHFSPIFLLLESTEFWLFLKYFPSISMYPKYPKTSELVPSSVKSFGLGVAVNNCLNFTFLTNEVTLFFIFPLKFFKIEDSSR